MASEYVFWDEMWNQSSENKPIEEPEYKKQWEDWQSGRSRQS